MTMKQKRGMMNLFIDWSQARSIGEPLNSDGEQLKFGTEP